MEAAGRPLVTIAESLIEVARQLSRQAELDAAAFASAARAAKRSPAPNLTADDVLALRRLRKSFLPDTLFHEPAWEILLVLYANADRAALSLKELSFRVDAPFTTTQRWVDHMVKTGLVHRAEGESDRRRVELALSPDCMERLDGYFAAAGQP